MMNKIIQHKYIFLLVIFSICSSCKKEFLELEPRGTRLETSFYKTQEELFEALVATYDVLQWGGTDGWTMKLGLLNTASDDCYAGGSDASDQPTWVAFDNFTLHSELGPQLGLWQKYYSGIYRANLVLEKVEEVADLDATFKARTIAEAKFLRAYYFFDLVRFFGEVPLITNTLGGDELYTQIQAPVADIYAQIEQDLNDARNTFELPITLPPAEFGRITQGAAKALLGKVILYQNNNARMTEAATLLEEVATSGTYSLEGDFGNIFSTGNEFGSESVFEISFSGAQRGGWGNFGNGTEGNYSVQFFGMRDYVGPLYEVGYGFCPVTEKLATKMMGDPRFDHTIIDGNQLVNQQGASYSIGFQNTNYFVRKYAPLQDNRASDGEPALNWNNNIIDIRLADVMLMAAEAYARGGNDGSATALLNQVRDRVGLASVNASGQALLDAIYNERQLELATEGHRFFDLVRTGRATAEIGDQGFTANKNELLPLPQTEIDIAGGNLKQNQGY